MKVAIPVKDAWKQVGGVPRYVQAVTRHFIRLSRGHPDLKILFFYRGEVALDLLSSNVELRRLPLPIGNNLLGIPYALSREKDIDIVFYPFQVCLGQGNFKRILMVYDLSPLLFPEHYSLRSRLYARLFTKMSCRMADRVVVPSCFVRESIVRFWGIDPNRIVVNSLGYDPETYHPDLPQEERRAVLNRYGIAGPFLLYVGSLQPNKNLELIIAGVRHALGSIGREVEVIFAGRPLNDRYRASLVRSAQEKGVKVRCLTSVSDTDTAVLMGMCQAFLFPSLVEGFGLAALEAMACGAPVIALRGTAAGEVVGQGGMLIENDPVELGRTLVSIFQDPGFAEEVRQRARKRAHEFSWQEHCRTLISLFYSLYKASLT